MSRFSSNWISDYVKATENSEPPRIYREWVAVSLVASCLQRKCWIEWGEEKLFPNMFIVLVGPSGKCRKGTAMNQGRKFLEHLGIKLSADATTREALIKDIEDSAQMVALGDRQIPHSSITVFSPELMVFLDFKNPMLLTNMTDWYDCRSPWSYKTKHQGDNNIIGLWVNLLGATTPDLILSSFPRDAIGGGLASRILFIYAEDKEKLVPVPTFNATMREPLMKDLEAVWALAGRFRIDENLWDFYNEWYVKECGNLPPYLGVDLLSGYAARRATHLKKLTSIVCAARADDMVMTVEDMQRAMRILYEAEVTMASCFRGYGRSPVAESMDKLMRFITRSGEAKMSELLAMSYRDVSYDELTVMLRTLVNMNYIKIDRIANSHDSVVKCVKRV